MQHKMRIFLMLNAFVLTHFIASAAMALDTDGLVGAWLFDDGKGQIVRDSSGNELHGVIKLGTPKWVQGRFGGAMEFGGADMVTVSDDDLLDLETFTLAAWVNIPRITEKWQIIASKENRNPWSRNYGLFGNINTGVIHYSFTTDMTWKSFDAKTVVTDGEWHHVASTYDGADFKLYLDGALDGQGSPGTKPDTHDNVLFIGGHDVEDPWGSPYWMSGTIDELILYNRALNTKEINELMRDGMSAALSGAVQAEVSLSFTMPAEVSVGKEFTATLNIADAVDLAGVQFDLHFNPTVLEPTDIHEGDFLSGGGAFFQVAHFATVPGEISGIRIAQASGVDGSGVLLKVDFKAKGAGVSALEVRGLKLGTSVGTPIPAEAVSVEVAVKPRPDVTGDGRVDILDLVRITRHFGPASAAPAGLDINGDGDIDILDLILVAHHLGT